MKKLLEILFILIHPLCWIQNYKYDPKWDRELNELMEVHQFTNIDAYTATINGITVWVANFPYACFTIQRPSPPWRDPTVRPSRITIYKAMEKLKKDYYTQTN